MAWDAWWHYSISGPSKASPTERAARYHSLRVHLQNRSINMNCRKSLNFSCLRANTAKASDEYSIKSMPN